jgi:hypothetical protein
MNVHIYNREPNGSLTHSVGPNCDLGGNLDVTGDVRPLKGWPTPAMRSAVTSHGERMCWYIGTTRDGKIIDADLTQSIVAKWDDGAYWAQADSGVVWHSRDGDSWLTAAGHPASGDEFEAASISLVGGPRSGVTVA